MARGNQRDKAREKNLKNQSQQKNKNTQTGTEFARTKEDQAAIMRRKQAEGTLVSFVITGAFWLTQGWGFQPMLNGRLKAQGRSERNVYDGLVVVTSKRPRLDDLAGVYGDNTGHSVVVMATIEP